MASFSNIYFIRNNAGTYEAYDSAGSLIFSGASLVTNVLNAIESAHPAGGYAVLFGAGTFDMGTENWTLNGVSDVTIPGLGPKVTRIINSSDAAADTEPFSFTNCDRITIRDLEVAAGGAARTTSDALDFDNSDECLVERVHVTDARGRGIVFDGKDAGAQARGNVVRDCVVTGTRGGTSQAGSGIQLLAADRCVIDNCFIYDTTGPGIQIAKASSAAGQPNKKSTHNVIKGCRIENAGTRGITLQSSDDNLIVANQIVNSSDDAASHDGIRLETTNSISADRNVIGLNVITDTQGVKTQRWGVNITPAVAAEANDNIVMGNILEGNLTGALLDSGTRTRVRNNEGAPDNTHQAVSAATTLVPDDPRAIIDVNSAGAAVTITLPDNAAAKGRGFLIRRSGANAVTVARAGTNTIDGAAANKTLGSDKASIGLFSVGGGDWKVVATQGTVT